MSAKAKPAYKMRPRALALATGENGNDKGAFYRLTSGRACKRDAERKPIDRFDGGDLLPPTTLDQARTWIANAGPAEYQQPA